MAYSTMIAIVILGLLIGGSLSALVRWPSLRAAILTLAVTAFGPMIGEYVIRKSNGDCVHHLISLSSGAPKLSLTICIVVGLTIGLAPAIWRRLRARLSQRNEGAGSDALPDLRQSQRSRSASLPKQTAD